jgi:hypothetical protein
VSISIDISGELPKVMYDIKAMRQRVAELAEMARGEWIRQAQTNLQGSAADYIAGIQPVEVRGNWAAVQLTGWLPNQIENGMNPFDMKPGLLAGPHAKSGKNGARFNTIPFRHGTPGTGGRNVGAPMPTTGYTPKGKPRSLVYTAARKLAASLETSTGKTKWGGRTGDFGGLGIRTARPVPGGRPGAYTWKASPYASMVKVAKAYKKATQNQYVTFRRVSDNSDPTSWWHPGIRARRLSLKVGTYVKKQVKKVF